MKKLGSSKLPAEAYKIDPFPLRAGTHEQKKTRSVPLLGKLKETWEKLRYRKEKWKFDKFHASITKNPPSLAARKSASNPEHALAPNEAHNMSPQKKLQHWIKGSVNNKLKNPSRRLPTIKENSYATTPPTTPPTTPKPKKLTKPNPHAKLNFFLENPHIPLQNNLVDRGGIGSKQDMEKHKSPNKLIKRPPKKPQLPNMDMKKRLENAADTPYRPATQKAHSRSQDSSFKR
jgi:hypothetical protein